MFDTKLIRYFIDLLLPRHCLLCLEKSDSRYNLCAACQQALPILPQVCRQCARPMPSLLIQPRCAICLKKTPPFSASYALFPYQSPIKQWLLALKFHGKLHHAALFAHLLNDSIRNHWYFDQPLPDLLVPVPLYASRVCERGFNQAAAIAKPLSKKLGITLDLHSVKRIKYTQPQSQLSAKDRKKNIKNAFLSVSDYSNLTIAILDDVLTTGQTVTALAAHLKERGAKIIHIWCVAKAFLDPEDKA